MGTENAYAGFQKTMYHVMKPCHDFSQVFLDDIILYSKTFDEHIMHLRMAFTSLAKDKLVLNASRCELAVKKVVVLGHTVSETSIAPTDYAVQAIIDLPEPRPLKQRLITASLFLRFPVDDFPLHLSTDACRIATGGVLYQDINSVRHNIFYHSKVLSPVEQKYSVLEKD